MENEEEWRDIPELKGFYQASNLGRIRTVDRFINSGNFSHRRFSKIINPKLNGFGYLRVCIFTNGKRRLAFVHRLVASAFIPNPNNRQWVNHKDENKTNNKVNNLEWCDSLYNYHYGTGPKRRSISRSKPIAQLSLNGELVKIWYGTREACRNMHAYPSGICRVLKGKAKVAYGYKWEYV